MAKRLEEIYSLHQVVEIALPYGAASGWKVGVVVAHEFPGIWVQMADGSRWFVTNRRHIRPRSASGQEAESGC